MEKYTEISAGKRFYLEFSVEAAISLSFDYFSIVTQVLKIHFLTFFRLFEKIYLDFSVIFFHLETNVGILS